MPTLFLSHTHIDKPFVEKLANDLMKLGIQVWYDNYEIKVGESIFWKVDEGLSNSQYFGIVLSPESLNSEWVRTELSAAWEKHIKTENGRILPILYRSCELPVLLKTIKYADFRSSYDQGLSNLVKVFGIAGIDAITLDNWRSFVGKRESNWRAFQEEEFKLLITRLCKILKENNYSIWVGSSRRPPSFSISAPGIYIEEFDGGLMKRRGIGFSVRMNPKMNYQYVLAESDACNPRHVEISSYVKSIGSTVNEVCEFVSERLSEYISLYGKPTEEAFFHTTRMDRLRPKHMPEISKRLLQYIDWNQDML